MDYRGYLQWSDGNPNMIALFALSGVVAKETKAFFKAEKHKM